MKGGAILPVIIAAGTPFIVLIVLVSGVGFGLVLWQPPVLWTNSFGGSIGGDNAVAGVSADSSGVYLASYSNYTAIETPGGSLFLSKYVPSGGLVWSRTIGNSNMDIAAISVGVDGIFVTGINAAPTVVM